jgi:hypothetical protein
VSSNVIWGSFKDIKTDYVMFSSVFYDNTNIDAINKIMLDKKVIIGFLQPDLPNYLAIKMNKIKLNVDVDLYVFTNKDHYL